MRCAADGLTLRKTEESLIGTVGVLQGKGGIGSTRFLALSTPWPPRRRRGCKVVDASITVRGKGV
jgi:hypothetical protein